MSKRRRSARSGPRRQPQSPPPVDYFPNLNALRGIAALLIVLYHVDLYSNLFTSHGAAAFIGRSYLMVDLFFALSGFVMCHVYRRWFERSVDRRQVRRFMAARFARIYPLHLLSLAYFVVLMVCRYRANPASWLPVQSVLYSARTISHNLLLLHGMNTTSYASWNESSWSISTEWWMYLLFPFLLKPILAVRRIPGILLAATGLAGYVAIMLLLVPRVTVPHALVSEQPDPSTMTIGVTYQFGFIRCAIGFVLGMLTYRLFAAGVGQRWLSGAAPLALWSAAAIWCLHEGYPDPITVACFFPLILSAAYGGPSGNALLGTRALQRLGDWSYAIYMLHLPLIQTMFFLLMLGVIPDPRTSTQLWQLFLVYVVVTVIASWVVHVLVELPLRTRVKDWLSPQRLDDRVA